MIGHRNGHADGRGVVGGVVCAADGVGPETSEAERAARLREVEPIIRRVCRGRLAPMEADEAAQRALVRVWQTLGSGRELDTVRGYAISTARFEVLNTLRDESRAPTPSEFTNHGWVDETPGPEQQAERRDEVARARARVEELLAQLPERQVSLLRATVLADRAPAEVAAELGATAHAVRQSNVRAMERLRELCGTRTANSLALPGTRNERRRAAEAARTQARAEAHDSVPRKRGTALPAAVHQTGQAAAAEGRSAVELADQFGVSEHTARRWRRLAAEEMGPEAWARRQPQRAEGPSAKERRRAVETARTAARAAAHGHPDRPRGVRLPAELHEARRAAAALGRSAVELADEFGVSEKTAQAWRRHASDVAARAARPGTRAVDGPDGLPAAARTGPADTGAAALPLTSDGLTDGNDRRGAGRGVDGQENDPLVRAREVVGELPSPREAADLIDERDQLDHAGARSDAGDIGRGDEDSAHAHEHDGAVSAA